MRNYTPFPPGTKASIVLFRNKGGRFLRLLSRAFRATTCYWPSRRRSLSSLNSCRIALSLNAQEALISLSSAAVEM